MIEYFSGVNIMQMPLTGKPEPKRRFLPSKWEHKKVCFSAKLDVARL